MADEQQKQEYSSEIDEKLDILKKLDPESLRLLVGFKISKEDLQRLRAAKAHIGDVNLSDLKKAVEAYRIAKPKLDELVEAAALLPDEDKARDYVELVRTLGGLEIPDLGKLEELVKNFETLQQTRSKLQEMSGRAYDDVAAANVLAQQAKSTAESAKTLLGSMSEDILETRKTLKSTKEQVEQTAEDAKEGIKELETHAEGVFRTVKASGHQAKGLNSLPLDSKNMVNTPGLEDIVENQLRLKGLGDQKVLVSSDYLLKDGAVISIRGPDEIYLVENQTTNEITRSPDGEYKFKRTNVDISEPLKSTLRAVWEDYNSIKGNYRPPSRASEMPEHWAEAAELHADPIPPQSSVQEQLDDALGHSSQEPESIARPAEEKKPDTLDQVVKPAKASAESLRYREHNKFVNSEYEVASDLSSIIVDKAAKIEYKGFLGKKFHITDSKGEKYVAKLEKQGSGIGYYNMLNLNNDGFMFDYDLIDVQTKKKIVLETVKDIAMVNVLYSRTQVSFD